MKTIFSLVSGVVLLIIGAWFIVTDSITIPGVVLLASGALVIAAGLFDRRVQSKRESDSGMIQS